MVQFTFRRSLAVFIVAMVLAAATASAAVPPRESLWEGWGRAAWSWLAGAGAFGKHGCSIDPNGTPSCAPVTPKHGCSIDPDGTPNCAPVTPKHGCSINPDGTPNCAPVTPKAGCSINPNGTPNCSD